MKISLARVLAGALVSVFAFSACNCMPDIVSAPFEAKDLRPASLKSWGASSRRELVLAFDETVRAQAMDFAFSRQEGSAMPESLAVESLSAAENGENPAESRIVLLVSADFDPGIPYAVSGIVYDDNGNATNFTLPFWGFNPDTPEYRRFGKASRRY